MSRRSSSRPTRRPGAGPAWTSSTYRGRPGPVDLMSKDYLEKLFADQIDGHRLLVNNSRWASFRTRRTRRWHVMAPRPVALARRRRAHRALLRRLRAPRWRWKTRSRCRRRWPAHPGDLEAALAAYEQAAQPPVRRIQDSARPSLAWWEHFGSYYDAFEPWQFAYHFLSRSITDARLARRAPDFTAASHRAWHRGVRGRNRCGPRSRAAAGPSPAAS